MILRLLISSTAIKSIGWTILLVNWLPISCLSTLIISLPQWNSVSFERFLVHERILGFRSTSASVFLSHISWDCHWYTPFRKFVHSLVVILISILKGRISIIHLLLALAIYVVFIVHRLTRILVSFVFFQNLLNIHAISLGFSLLF